VLEFEQFADRLVALVGQSVGVARFGVLGRALISRVFPVGGHGVSIRGGEMSRA
jgi:hypothetical protein